jgi:glycosyltransferase involved in cell wall biosynthesis
MVNLLDPGTFVFRAFDSDATPSTNVLDEPARHWIEHRHPYVAGAFHELMVSGESPHAVAQTVARTKILGLRLLIDGSILGPQEMGTQVALMSLVSALAAHDDVSSVTVALTGPVPRYAERALSGPSVQLKTIDLRDLSAVGPVDVAHRPIQPTDGLDLTPWRDHASRISITVLDLIGYGNGAYHANPDEWLTYRNRLRGAVNQADGVVVIAEDVADQMHLHRMPIDSERVYPVALGTDHLTGAPSTELRVPTQLLQRGFVASRFIFALGTNYAHKNRDLAIAAFEELRRRDPSLCLVLVGAYVPYGSSRLAETRLLNEANTPNVYTLTDCTSEERNWLFKHAELVLYATSAEGFGLVPYEAAQFGTPSVFVSFGPLREVAGPELPVFAADWSTRSLAEAMAALLYDPDVASAQLAAVQAAAHRYTWARTADKMVAAYRHMLSNPRR